jgi:hypothetical protein
LTLTANMRRGRNTIRNMIVADILFDVLIVIVGGGDVDIVHLPQKYGQRPSSTTRAKYLRLESQR